MKKFLITFLAWVMVGKIWGQDLNLLSSKVDAVLQKQYSSTNIKPLAKIDDETFLRRAYLTIIGRNPTLEEYNSFSSVEAENKRSELIKFLLKHPGHVSHIYNFWADALRLRERLAPINNFNGAPYIQYIKSNIAANKPYDKFVSDLLLSQGSYFDNPATGYYYRDFGMPLDNLIATSKVFLGTDISCAQCHDDPFQDFTQMQFYRMAAVFNQIDLRKESTEFREAYKNLRNEVDARIKADPEKNRGLNNRINNFVRATQSDLSLALNKQLKLPHDYQYKDAKPNDVVVPATLDGKAVKNSNDLRQSAIEWMLDPSHPSFTKNIVNRYWGFIFGKYIIEEFDNIHSSSLLNSELMNILANIFIELKYDSRQFLFVLLNTELFQRQMYEGAYANSENFIFIGPVKKRLSAEQLWDSVISLTINRPESFQTTFHKQYSENMKVSVSDLNVETLEARLKTNNDILRSKYEAAKRIKGLSLVRASEINDLNQMNTILGQLGRSDRELIQTSSLDGSVTQVISFMNGQMAELAINKETQLFSDLNGKSPTDKIEIIFKSVLARKPTMQEKATFAGLGDDDIVWALLNSSEFKFLK
jgi:hypothetical protein